MRRMTIALVLACLVTGMLAAQDERAAERRRMVERDIAGEGISDRAVLDAMRSVPRHEFVPTEHRGRAYAPD